MLDITASIDKQPSRACAKSGSAGKTKIGRPDPCFTLPRPAVLLAKIGLCSEVSDFPRTSEKTRYNRAPEREKRAKRPSASSPLNAKTAFRRSPRTKPDVQSQGLFTVGALRKSPIPVNPLPRNPSELRPSNNASVKLRASRKTPVISPFLN